MTGATATPGPVSVALVDDHPIVIRGLRQLLTGSRFRVVAEAGNREDCLRMSTTTQPQIVVLDLRLGDDLAPDVCRDLRRAGVSAKVVIVTGHDDVELLRACLDEGVVGILLKEARDLDIVAMLERVLRGETVVDHRLSALLPADADRRDKDGVGLTAREHEVLRLVARGMTSREIAAELFLSVNTVRSYVQSLMMKLDAHTRIDAITTARRLRLI